MIKRFGNIRNIENPAANPEKRDIDFGQAEIDAAVEEYILKDLDRIALILRNLIKS